MRLSAGSLLALIVCASAILPRVSVAESPGSGKEQVGDKVVYARYDQQGRKESEVSGDQAEVLPSGDVEVTNLLLVLYDYSGKGGMRIAAAKCLYRIDEGVVESESDVRIESSSVVIYGKGFRWFEKKRVVQILDAVRVELNSVRDWTKNDEQKPEN